MGKSRYYFIDTETKDIIHTDKFGGKLNKFLQNKIDKFIFNGKDTKDIFKNMQLLKAFHKKPFPDMCDSMTFTNYIQKYYPNFLLIEKPNKSKICITCKKDMPWFHYGKRMRKCNDCIEKINLEKKEKEKNIKLQKLKKYRNQLEREFNRKEQAKQSHYNKIIKEQLKEEREFNRNNRKCKKCNQFTPKTNFSGPTSYMCNGCKELKRQKSIQKDRERQKQFYHNKIIECKWCNTKGRRKDFIKGVCKQCRQTYEEQVILQKYIKNNISLHNTEIPKTCYHCGTKNEVSSFKGRFRCTNCIDKYTSLWQMCKTKFSHLQGRSLWRKFLIEKQIIPCRICGNKNHKIYFIGNCCTNCYKSSGISVEYGEKEYKRNWNIKDTKEKKEEEIFIKFLNATKQGKDNE